LNILFATTEAAPFAKTGGLADVCGALPMELARLGHRVAVMMPAFRQVRGGGWPIESTGIEIGVPVGGRTMRGRLLLGQLPGGCVPVYFVEQDRYYDRPELYREKGEDYKDNCERFVFFCRAVMESIRLLDLPLDVLHCHDWQTGLIPAYLKTAYASARGYENIVSLLTIHNMAYQGRFWHWDMPLTGLDWQYFNWRQMEFFGQLNLLKTGIVFADAINTVSPQYACEIQSVPLGCGLEGVLQDRRDVLCGIMNGVDYDVWSPSIDPHLAANYDDKSWQEGKAACKAALQKELGLTPSPATPLIGLIGRLADQKGWDLVAQVLPRWTREAEVQWAILGTGDPRYHELLSKLAANGSSRMAARLAFSDPLAHRIEAGADMFLMPSRYEPCGLNQLYSLKYGAAPIVRATGGLADSITSATPANLAAGVANGFSFQRYDAAALDGALRQACDFYLRQPNAWRRLVTAGMRQDWSWGRSARHYIALYERMAARR
jgi:starch synthase